MNTQTIHYTTRPTRSLLVAIVNGIRSFFVRRQTRKDSMPTRESVRQGDLLRSMPVEEKLRLGMYRYMD